MSLSTYRIDSKTSLNVVVSGIQKPTLIFLHFWGGSAQTFSSTISNLSNAYQTVSIDFRGWGNSTGPDSAEAYSINHLATDVETLIQKMDIGEFVLIGHSMGGKVAQLIAGRNLIHGLRGVILIASAPPTPFQLPPDMRRTQGMAYSSPGSAEFVARNVLTASVLSDDVVGMLVQDMQKGNEFAKAAWPAYAMAEDIVADARKIDVPVLVIAGELDKVEPVRRLESEVVKNITHAKMVVIEASGHLIPVEAPLKLALAITDFIERLLEAS
ncbi:hypothetical protein B7494_g6045 [Chlorociboria aeruginascens]|nr:hypothetical protein B7494_g6045 [Chlorociboria aeruginascens]